jgi:hypothetical protein
MRQQAMKSQADAKSPSEPVQPDRHGKALPGKRPEGRDAARVKEN